jgi:hypothetical protein
MSQVIIAGDTSGTITLQAPAVSGSTTLTLPATTATLATLTTPSFASTIGVGGATASASGAGISFPATQSASSDANTLDDYEEGTWTPSVGGTATYTRQSGTYVKVGQIVNISFDLIINVIGTGSTSSISGAPFQTLASVSMARYGGPGTSFFTNLAGSFTFIALGIDENATNIAFATTNSAQSSITNAPTVLGTGARVAGTLTYRCNS